MGFWADLGRLACHCAFFVGNVIVEAGLTVSDYIEKASTSNSTAGATTRKRYDIQRGLHDINLHLHDLVMKRSYDGKLSQRDKDRFSELKEEREQAKGELWGAKEAETAAEIRQNPDSVKSVIITPQNPQLIQYHIGQCAVFKDCPICGRAMNLQFPRAGRQQQQRNTFFWACTGYYFNRACNHIEPYSHTDSKLLSPTEVPELQIEEADFNVICSNKSVQRESFRRIREHHDEDASDYICPVHGEPLLLREKHNPEGALDQFFMGCPYWRGNAPGSCTYVVKLKSWSQLAAVLKSYEGRGIL